MGDSETASNKGILKENFRLFHLKDRRRLTVNSHYHEFDKVLVFFGGGVEYTVEGVSYKLQAGDILFIRHHDIHMLTVNEKSEYERAVLWISPAYLKELGSELDSCFELSAQRHAYLYHPENEVWQRIKRLIADLERAGETSEFGSELLCQSCFTQLMVELNRCVINEHPKSSLSRDGVIDDIMRYISCNLNAELSVEQLASMCYLSRFYFMRRFKEATGYTVHGYIQLKRLTLAAELLGAGMSVTDAAASAGFTEYSSFLRAFRKLYKMSPREYVHSRGDSVEGSYEE